MDYFFFTLKSALFDFSRNKGRTFLTSLGILIGVLAVVLLTAAGLGLRKYIQQQFELLGSNLITVLPGNLDEGFSSGGPAFGRINFSEQDFQNLKRIRQIKLVVPLYSRSFTIYGGDSSKYAELYASSADIFTTFNQKAEYGKLFTERDVNKRAKIVVIGPKIAETLFGSPKKALGKSVKIDNQSFRVSGITESKGGGLTSQDLDNAVYMPYKTAYVFNPGKTMMAFYLQARTEEAIPEVKRLAEQTMLKNFADDEFSIVEQEDLISTITSIFSIVNSVLIAIAAISLLVGGIGIMNIMYVTVTERIKEIGIRRALGARKFDILSQFLIESIILSLFGGISGLVLSYLIVLGVQQFFPAYIDAFSVVLALGVSSAIGIIFGVFPAKKAADLSPIEAIRYE